MYESRIFKTPCPAPCGGKVESWSFDDCSYSSGSGINCKKCGKKFSWEEWKNIAAKELRPELRKQKRAAKALENTQRKERELRTRALAKLSRKEKISLGLNEKDE